MKKVRKMHTTYEKFMAVQIEASLNVPLYESKFSENVIEDLVDTYVKVDYQLTVKDENVTIELEEAPESKNIFLDKMYGSDVTLVKVGEEGAVANYLAEETDKLEKKTAEEHMITVWLTTIPDSENTWDDWDWDGSTLSLLADNLEVVKAYSRKELVAKINNFPQA